MEDNYKKVPLLDKHNKNEVDKIIKEYNNLFREVDELKVKIEKMKYNEISSFKPVIIQINAFGDKIKNFKIVHILYMTFLSIKLLSNLISCFNCLDK